MNKDFNDRFTLGEIAVRDLTKILKNKNIPYITCKEYFGNKWSRLMDKNWGDIILHPNTQNEIWIDVKYNSISETSLFRFKGNYFWIFRYMTYPDKNIFIDSITLTRDDVYNMIDNKVLNQSNLRSSSPGYKMVHKNVAIEIPSSVQATSKGHQDNILGTFR